MKWLLLTVASTWLTALAVAAETTPALEPLAWPPITRECRPWAYWWWHGSAVNAEDLTREMNRYRDGGLGGVHIIPIYGVKGFEERELEYLSPPWLAMLQHTVTEGQRLDLGVDMTTGTGWCFGGPNVSDADANAAVVTKTWDVAAGKSLPEKLDPQVVQAIVAFAPDGKCEELTNELGADGVVAWTPPAGTWRVYAVSQKPSGVRVKRAAKGGAGHMLNLFSPAGVQRYLERFTAAFATYDGPKPRAMYHDSYEYRSEWSPQLFAEFERRRGYRLQTELPALFSKDQNDHVARVKADYRETLSDLMVEGSLPAWVQWSHEHGFLTRNQAHGSPGNLLDLYAAADIPETEMFNLDRSTLVSKFASSAAHVSGKRLVASETGTWLREHFTETLADVKELVDQLFVAGVNHVIYHGTCYSPDEAAWPGWLFYASTEMNPRNSIWRDVPALNTYIARCQAVLQSGRPDNDILLYWPIHDIWHNPKGLVQSFSVHARFWLEDQPLGKLAQQLLDRGYSFDFASDRQLASARVEQGSLITPGGTYKVLVVPPSDRMPTATLERLLAFANSGVTIIFADHVPTQVPGWKDVEKRQTQAAQLVERLVSAANAARKGRVLIGDVDALLQQVGVPRESLVDLAKLWFIRRAWEGGRHYFIVNRDAKPLDGWLTLATPAATAAIMNPLTNRTGVAKLRRAKDGQPQVYLQLQPGESVVLRTVTAGQIAGPKWPYMQPAGSPVELSGSWQVKFVAGGPELPAPFETKNLSSWTELGGEAAQRFAGMALYRLTFDAPTSGRGSPRHRRSTIESGNAAPVHWVLDLGRVCQSARLRLNGQELGTVFTAPFRVAVEELKPTANVLEVEVTNVSANRIRDLDRRHVAWKVFQDINFVNTAYKPFDAADWPLAESGLLGPVQLLPMSAAEVTGGR